MLYGLGALELGHSRVPNAVAHFEEALRCYTEAGEDHGRAMTLRSLALGDRMRATWTWRCPLRGGPAIFREVGDRYCEAHTLSTWRRPSWTRAARGGHALRPRRARMEEGRGSDTRSLAQALYRLGRVYGALGQLEAAEESFLRAVRIVKEKADMIGLAHTCSASARPGWARATPSWPRPR